jgi:TonB-linked SusC/RagA family outer membrane protein
MKYSLIGIIMQTICLSFLLADELEAQESVKEARIQLNLQNVSIQEAFKSIESQTDYVFSYDRQVLEGLDQRISFSGKRVTVEAFLLYISKAANLRFRQVNNNINVVKSKDGHQTVTIQQVSQSRQVTGTVTDEKAEGLPGVNVIVKGSSQGTVTDLSGNYSLDVPSAESVLVYSSVGYISEEVEVGNRSVIDLALNPDITALEEIIVIGYGAAKKSDLTGAVVRADLEALQEQPNVNVLQSLQGTVPGLNVGVATSAGATPSFSIRGQNSLSGTNEPLIVVDGIIYRGNLRDLNTNDIASIDVLKDASSTAIYGSQAANGVIIISTKSGKTSPTGKPTFNYSGSAGISEAAHVPEYYDREGYIGLFEKQWWRQSRQAPDYITPVPDFDPVATGLMPEEMEDAFDNGYGTDWWDLISQNGFVQTHTLSMSGNTDKSNYFISASYSNQEDIIINDKYRKVTGRVNFENEINDWLKIGVNSFATSNNLSGAEPSVNDGYNFPPLSKPYDDNGELILLPTGLLRRNPLYALEEDNYNHVLSLSGIVYAVVTIPQVEGLSYRVNYSNNYRDYRFSNFDPTAQNFAGEALKRNESNYDWTLDNIVSYKRTFNNIHGIDVTLLYGREYRTGEGTDALSTGFVNPALGYNGLDNGTVFQNSSYAWEENNVYSMARVQYNLKEKYLLTGTVRRDGFSGFGSNNKFGTFPSIAAGWVISEESFLDNANWLNFMKLRASYGTNGNRTVGRYATLARIATQPAYVFGEGGGTKIGQAITNLANDDLGWETTTGINLGLDFSILEGRIGGNIDYYNTTTSNLLYNINIPEISGFNDIASNLGEIANQGIEFTINTVNIQNANFQWNSSFNYSRNTNEIVSILGRDDDGDGVEDDIIGSGLFIGEPIGTIYGYVPDGIYQFGDDIPSGYDVGQYRIKNFDDNPAIDPTKDQTIIGYEEPAYRFSLNNEFQYKNWSLKVYLYSIQGGANGYYGNNSPHVDYLDPDQIVTYYNIPTEWDFWTPENPDAEYPSLWNKTAINIRTYRQRSFVRLQNVSLSYSFNQPFLEKIGIRNLKAFVNGNNLATWTDWNGWDPETGVGLTRARAGRPLPRTYTFGLNFSF